MVSDVKGCEGVLFEDLFPFTITLPLLSNNSHQRPLVLGRKKTTLHSSVYLLPLPSRQECVGAKSKDWQTEGQARGTLGAQWTGLCFFLRQLRPYFGKVQSEKNSKVNSPVADYFSGGKCERQRAFPSAVR